MNMSDLNAPDLNTPVQVYGLERCDTCRKARNWLTRFGIAHQFHDYRAERIDPARLREWAGQLGGWDALINRNSTAWRNLLPDRRHPGSEAEWQLLLKEYPTLIRRPLTWSADGVISVGFKDALYKKRFGV